MWSRPVVVLVLLLAACSRSPEASRAPAPTPTTTATTATASTTATTATTATAAAPLTCRTLESCTDACSDAACAEACVRRLTVAARPAYDALQACVKPACAGDGDSAPCRAPGALACKMCVLAHCASQAATCMKN